MAVTKIKTIMNTRLSESHPGTHFVQGDLQLKTLLVLYKSNELPNIPTNCPKNQRTSQYSNELTHKSNEST